MDAANQIFIFLVCVLVGVASGVVYELFYILRKLCGDVDFQAVEKVAGAISPVPGGCGPMTVTMLIKNLLAAYDRQHKTE